MPNFDAIVNLPSITVERVEAGNPLIVHATYHGEVHCLTVVVIDFVKKPSLCVR
jgi:hypothetical protein